MIKDTKVSPAYVQGNTYFDGSIFSFNSTPGEETFEINHKSGSSIKFDSAGTISIIAEKDIMIRAKNGENSHIQVNGDFDMDISKEMKIKCNKYDLDGGKAIRQSAKVVTTKAEKEHVLKGEAFTIEGSNTIHVETNTINTVVNTMEHQVNGVFIMTAVNGFSVTQLNPKGGMEFSNLGFWTNDTAMSMYTTVGLERVDTTGLGQTITAGGVLMVRAFRIYLN
jgi:hypothetical protein